MAETPESVRRKTEILIHEGDSPSQANAIAWNLYRKRRLGKRGGIKGKRRGKRIWRGGKRVTIRKGFRR